MAWVAFEVLDQRVEFIRRQRPVFRSAETAECNTSESHVLGRDLDTVDRRGTGKQHSDEREVDGEPGRSRALFRAPLAVLDKARSM